MPRIRSIHPGQWTDDAFVVCSPLARLLAIAIRNEADDNGVFEWNIVKIKMRLLPMDSCDIGELLGEIAGFEQIFQYEISGKKYGIIRNFRRWQRPKKPKAYYPLPPEPFSNCDGLITPESPINSELTPNQSGTLPSEKKEGVAGSVKKKRSSTARKTSAPDTLQITEDMHSYAASKGVADKARLEDVTEAFLQHHKAKGSKFSDWHAAWQGWVRREVEFKGRDAAQGGVQMSEGDV